MADFANPLLAFQQGVDTVKGLQQDEARRVAGANLSTGNYRAASNPLLGAGLLKEGLAVQEMGFEQAALAKKQKDARDKAVIDYTGQLAASLGQAWSQYSAQDQDPNKAAAKARIVQGFDIGAQRLKELGETDDEIAMLRNQLSQDPDLTLRALGAAIEQKKLEFRTMGDETVAFDPQTGNVVNRVRGAKTVNVGEGGAVYEIPGTGGGGEAAPPSKQISTDLPKADFPAPGGGAPTGSRAARNNNPGNLRSSGDQWQGMTGVDPQGFVMFDTPENGQRAAAINLANQQRLHGINTLQGLVAKYAPASDNNDVGAYVSTLSRATGYAPDQPLDFTDPAVQAKILPVMFQVEGGGTPTRPQVAQSAPTSASQPTPANLQPGPQDQGESPRLLVQRPKAQVRTLTPKEVQAAGFLPGTIVQQRPDGSYNTVQSPNNQASPRKAEADLRREFNARPEVKDYREVSAAFKQIDTLAKQPPSAASDMSLVFSFMKMLDPGSVVREGEFANAQNAAGIPDRIQNAYNKAREGQLLNPKQRADFVRQAQAINGAREERFNRIADEYRAYATDYGVSPDRVVTKEAETPKADAEKPPKGARKGRDGKFYIADPNRPGSFPEVRKAPDGEWYFKSGNDFYRVRD